MVDKMNDNNEEHHDDFEQEFDFEGESEDILAAEESPEASQPNRTSPLSNETGRKNVIPALIGIVVVAFLGWKAIGWMSKKPEPIKQETKVAKLAPAPKSDGQVMAPPPSVPMESPLETSMAAVQKKMDDQNAATTQRITNLERDLANAVQSSMNASKSVASLQQDIAALSNMVQNLAFELKGMQEQRKKAPAAPKAQPKAERAIDSASPNLSVYAIIPGRAWLRTQQGKTITITEGDSVGEYGKVLKIDAGNGVVITSSGVTLR